MSGRAAWLRDLADKAGWDAHERREMHAAADELDRLRELLREWDEFGLKQIKATQLGLYARTRKEVGYGPKSEDE